MSADIKKSAQASGVRQEPVRRGAKGSQKEALQTHGAENSRLCIESAGLGMSVPEAKLLERHFTELKALKPEELMAVNLDVPAVVQRVLGVLPKVRPLRAGLVRCLGGFRVHWFDALPDYAVLLNSVHGAYLVAGRAQRPHAQLMQEGTQLRALLVGDVHSLERRGLVVARPLTRARGPLSAQNLATDLRMLAKSLQRSWVSIENRCAVTREELARSLACADRIQELLVLGRNEAPEATRARELRARVYTLLVRSYNETRHGVMFLRRDSGDADSVIPSLFAGRGKSRARRPVLTAKRRE